MIDTFMKKTQLKPDAQNACMSHFYIAGRSTTRSLSLLIQTRAIKRFVF